jgi:serine/threonine-protein kinase
MSDSSVIVPPGGVVGDGYVVSRLVGEGGMGSVFAAEKGGESFAVKVLLGDQHAPQFVARFLREAEVSAALRGPNLVPVVDMGFDERLQRLFLVMPLLQGRDLEQQLELGPLHPTVAVRLVAQAAAGLIILHGGGVVHRDIKPANIFLDIRDGVVTARVCDLGIAKLIEESSGGLTATGVTLGTPTFMSPEQLIDSRKVDARSDVWSLGMSLYTALTGQNPFASCRTFAELAVQLTTADVPFLQEHAPWIDPTLAALVHGTLLRQASDRCPSAAELLAALTDFLGGTAEVTEAMLQPIGDDVRSSVATSGARPRSWASRPGPTSQVKVNDPRIGQVVGRAYRLRKLLGQGGMGAVYEADGPAGVVAVKVMSTQNAHDAGSLKRFVREARAVMAVKSPHVVAVLDADTDPSQGAPFIAMERLQGEDLESLVRRVGALEPRTAAQLFVEACEGLEAAHRAGLVHRDIKPANLFLHEDGARVIVKICDFGVAKNVGVDGQQVSVNLTRTNNLLGSPIYMSPEQAQNAKDVDARTDLWSLSASLYQVLTGVRPWEGLDSLGEVIVAICTQMLPPLQDLAPWVDPELAEIVDRGLQKDRKARWASATEMKAALASYAGGLTLSRVSLTSLSRQTKERVAPRNSIALAQTESALASTPSTPSMSSTAAPVGKGRLFAAVAGGVVLLAGVGAALRFGGNATPVVASAPPPPASTSAPAVRIQARVIVSPRDARVAVGDKPTNLGPGGVLLLEGEPGEDFEVAVEAGDQLVKKTVKLVAQGKAEPSSIEVTPAPSASNKPVPVAPLAGGKPGPIKAKTGGDPAPPTTPPTAPPPPDQPPPVRLPNRF